MDPYQRALEWLSQDPDPETRAALQSVLDDHASVEIERQFTGGIVFGTAGLRGELGFGPRRMNRVVVARAAAGLGSYLLQHERSPRVVIGFDSRHNSEIFARDTAEILQGLGAEALLLPHFVPTPVLAFAIRYLAADAGIMVTASHNQATDNGYKVYLGDGTQITSPADVEISAEMAAIGRADQLARSSNYTVLGSDIVSAYIDAIADPAELTAQNITVAYTPMHGVGAQTFLAAAQRCGFGRIEMVSSQAQPDPNFATLPFPNPEEPGALDELLVLADHINADIALAHDPDADRLAVCVRDGQVMRLLTGDELGSLLAKILLEQGRTGTFANSIVSSTLLGKLAAAHGQPSVQTLTGFKWIGKVDNLAFGYEEALGYCVRPNLFGDKDGISAALLVLNYANELHQDGRSLVDELDDLAKEFGVHVTRQLSIRFTEVAELDATLDRFARKPPVALGSSQVAVIQDLAAPTDGLPSTPGMTLSLADGSRVTCRPSGTEPKLKCYVEVVVEARPSLIEAREKATQRLDHIMADLAVALSGAQDQ